MIMGVYLAVSAVVWAKAEVPPMPTQSIYVQDFANVLSTETKNKLNRMGIEIQKKTKAQVVVVTIDTLDETPIEQYSLELLRKWGIGDKSLNNGVLMLISTKDHQSRIEVGYGLEGALPDGKTGRIQDEYMISYFKDGDYNGGVINGYMALAQEVLKEYKTNAAEVSSPIAPNHKSLFDKIIETIGIVIVIILVILDFTFFGGRFTMMILAMLSRRGGGGGGGYGGGSGGGGGSSRRW